MNRLTYHDGYLDGLMFRRYNVRVVENGTDEHGQWWAVENIGETPAERARGAA